MAKVENYCEPEVMDAEDPLFILYTSGSTGKPKGVLHTTAGYLLYTAASLKWCFDLKDEDTWWCTADIGWVTGHSYIVYGPLCIGATSVMFEGVPTYPDPGRFWAVCEKFGVTQFYTAPTALRALMREGNEWPKKHDLSSLRILGTVGEPAHPRGPRLQLQGGPGTLQGPFRVCLHLLRPVRGALPYRGHRGAGRL